MTWSADQRERFIEFRLCWEGSINRRDLMEAFGISVPQASGDLRSFMAAHRGWMVYDASAKRYVPGRRLAAEARADPDEYLLHLRKLAAGEDSWLGTGVPTAEPPFLGRAVDAATLRAVVRAIRERRALRGLHQVIREARSMSIRMEPHALGSDGFRWHARAFLAGEGRFGDVVLSRLIDVEDDGPATSDAAHDALWQEEIRVVLRANRNLRDGPRRAVEREYRMQEGRRTETVRIALLPYFLTEHRLDFDPDEKADRGVHRLEVENVEEVRRALERTGFRVRMLGRGVAPEAVF